MFIIHPIWDTRDLNTDAKRKRINFRFAELLKKYIEIKGDECKLTRESLSDNVVSLETFVKRNPAPVTFTIDCYADIDKSISGYDILCDAPSALVDTLNYEFYRCGRKSIRPLGYKVTKKLQYGSVADITLYLGYVTNEEELAWLDDDSNLEKLVKAIIEGCYAPPILTLESADPAGNDDPYFYTFDTWKEEKLSGASAEVKEYMQGGLPIRYLSLTNTTDSTYWWHTKITHTTSVSCFFIGSIRVPSQKATYCIKVGDKLVERDTSDYNFTVQIEEFDVNPDDELYIGIKGAGNIDFAGIWVAPKPNLGNLDDPRNDYSIFPPGYRSVTKVSVAYKAADSVHIALTTANSLLTRAQDKDTLLSKSAAEIANTVNATTKSSSASSSGSSSSSSSSKTSSSIESMLTGAITLTSTALSTVAFASMFAGLAANIANQSKKKVTTVDPSKLISGLPGKDANIMPSSKDIKKHKKSMRDNAAAQQAANKIQAADEGGSSAAEAEAKDSLRVADSMIADSAVVDGIMAAADGAIKPPEKGSTGLSAASLKTISAGMTSSGGSVFARAQQEIVRRKKANKKPTLHPVVSTVPVGTLTVNVVRFASGSRTSPPFIERVADEAELKAYLADANKATNEVGKELKKMTGTSVEKLKDLPKYNSSFTPESSFAAQLPYTKVTNPVFYMYDKDGYTLSNTPKLSVTIADLEGITESNTSKTLTSTGMENRIIKLVWGGTIELPKGVAFTTDEGNSKTQLTAPYCGLPYGIPKDLINVLKETDSADVFTLDPEAIQQQEGSAKAKKSIESVGLGIGKLKDAASNAANISTSLNSVSSINLSTNIPVGDAKGIIDKAAGTGLLGDVDNKVSSLTDIRANLGGKL